MDYSRPRYPDYEAGGQIQHHFSPYADNGGYDYFNFNKTLLVVFSDTYIIVLNFC